MLTPEDYRQLAERCALLACDCATPGVAEELRTLALNYLTRAAMVRSRHISFSPRKGTSSVNIRSDWAILPAKCRPPCPKRQGGRCI
jgi:hypothetical protein